VSLALSSCGRRSVFVRQVRLVQATVAGTPSPGNLGKDRGDCWAGAGDQRSHETPNLRRARDGLAPRAGAHAFLHEQFMPLAEQEHALREQLLVVGQGRTPDSSDQ
jgi:hypothetical protein